MNLSDIRRNSDLSITKVPTGAPFSVEPLLGVTGSVTTAATPLIPMYITVPGFERNPKAGKLNDVPGTGFDLTFMLLINPETLNVGKTGNTQANYTRKGYVVQQWGLNQDTLSSTGKTAAFLLERGGITNSQRKYTVGFLNFMALVNAYKNNGYRLIDRTSLDAIEEATRVIDVVHGITIVYEGNTLMGHFSNFTLDEDAEHPFLLTYNFEFIVSLYGDTQNEVYGHYLKASDDLAKKQQGYKVKLLSSIERYSEVEEGGLIYDNNSEIIHRLWEEKTGLSWDVAVKKGIQDNTELYESLVDPLKYSELVKGIEGAKPAAWSKPLSSDPVKIYNNYKTYIDAITADVNANGYYWQGKTYKLKKPLDPIFVAGIMSTESGGNAYSISSAGAVGLMQVMPNTGKDLGVPDISGTLGENYPLNIRAGVNYLAYLSNTNREIDDVQVSVNGDENLIAIGYNGGPGAIRKYLIGQPRPKENVEYPYKVLHAKDVINNSNQFSETSEEIAEENKPIQQINFSFRTNKPLELVP